MENASKALLIAGTILIAIVLVAIGVRLFNSTTGTKEQVEVTMSSTEIAMHNNKFMKYAGKNKTLADIKALANEMIVNNSTTNNQVYFWIWDINGYNGTNYRSNSKIAEVAENLPNNIKYEIQPNINNRTSLINYIHIYKMN